MKQPYHQEFNLEILNKDFRILHSNTDFNNPRQSELFINYAKCINLLENCSPDLVFYKLDENRHPVLSNEYFVPLLSTSEELTLLSTHGLVFTFPSDHAYMPFPKEAEPHKFLSDSFFLRAELLERDARDKKIKQLLIAAQQEIQSSLDKQETEDMKARYQESVYYLISKAIHMF